MEKAPGVRERKKLETRHRLGDVAARLFAEHGFDAVSMSDVARAAGVSDQTVYNYFPTKPELALDRAGEILEHSRRLVADRDAAHAPADALRALLHEDIDRYVRGDADLERGEFPALCVQSTVVRRYALEFRNDQADAIASAIEQTDPDRHPLVVRAHAGALVAVIQVITERIGQAVLTAEDRDVIARTMRADADTALADAAAYFRSTDAVDRANRKAT